MEQLLEILNSVKPGVDYENESDLTKVLDSLTIVMLVARINDEFDIEITPMELIPENFKTVETIYALIKSLED